MQTLLYSFIQLKYFFIILQYCASFRCTTQWFIYIYVYTHQPRQHIKKQRHYFDNKDPPSQSYGFSSSHVWMWDWTINKAGCWRIDAFELWCWRRLLRVLWTARRSKQSILREISPEYSFEELMLKLKLQYSGHWCKELTHWKRPWGWERLKVGGEGDKRGWDGWMASPTRWTWVLVASGSWWWTGKPGVLQSMGLQRVRHNWVAELNWTTTELQNLCDDMDMRYLE